MNRSISLFGQSSWATAGTAARWIGWNDQNARCSAVMTLAGALAPWRQSRADVAAGHRRTGPDPLGQRRYLRVGELGIVFRHLRRAFGVSDGANQQACVGVAWNDRGPRFAALEHALARIESQPAFLIVGMAVEAGFHEQRTDLTLEELDLARGRLLRHLRRTKRSHSRCDNQDGRRTRQDHRGTGSGDHGG